MHKKVVWNKIYAKAKFYHLHLQNLIRKKIIVLFIAYKSHNIFRAYNVKQKKMYSFFDFLKIFIVRNIF